MRRGVDLDAAAVLEADHHEQAVRHVDRVGGAEAERGPSIEVHLLLDKRERVSAEVLELREDLQVVGRVGLGALLHLSIVPREALSGVGRLHTKCGLRLVPRELVGVGALGGEVAASVRHSLAEAH